MTKLILCDELKVPFWYRVCVWLLVHVKGMTEVAAINEMTRHIREY